MKRLLVLLSCVVLLWSCAGTVQQKPRFIWIEAAANFYFYANNQEAIARDCKQLAQSGFTDILVDVRPTNGDVLFQSGTGDQLTRLAKWSDDALRYVTRTADFDYLAEFIKAGHAAGLRVHAGVNMMVGGFSCDEGDYGMLYRTGRHDWAAVDNTPEGLENQMDDDDREGCRFLDPANPEVQEYLLAILGDLAAYKGLDGIVIDRCRYDDTALDAGYTEVAYKLFSDYIGHEPGRWPVLKQGHTFLDWEPDELDVQWLTFRCKVIHDFIARAADTVHSVAPGLQFANYVGGWFSEYYRSGVNWASPDYDLKANEPDYRWATPEYQATGIAPLLDYLFVGAYTGSDRIHGNQEKTMEGYATLARKRLHGDVRFAAGPDLGNEPGWSDGNQHEVIPEMVKTMLANADGLFVFDLCFVRLFNYWNDFN